MRTLGSKINYLKSRLIAGKDRIADGLIHASMRGQNMLFEGSATANVGGLIMLLIGAVIVYKLFVGVIPQTYMDAYNVTQTGGVMAGAAPSDKSTWNLMPTLLLFFGILGAAGLVMRAWGKR